MSEGFPSIALSAVASITMGQSPGAETYSSEENGLPFLQGCAEFGALHPQPEIYCELPLRVAKKDSILISVRAPVGTMNLADQDYCIGRGLGAVQGIAGKANTSFLRYAIAQNVGFLHRRSQGSTFLAISSGELRLLPVPDIGFRTQERIAEILSTLDKTIEKTEALIAKYQQIKAGLMHDLFTRGITTDGKLRPPRAQAPELYRETPIGWVPKEWDVLPANKVCSLITKGTTPPQNEMWQGGDGVRFLRVDNLSFDGSFIFDVSNFRISPDTHTVMLARSMCLPGDVLTNIVGPPLGKVGLIAEDTGEVNINQAIAIFRPGKTVSSYFLLQWLTTDFVKRWFLQRAKQTSGQLNLTLAMCQSLPIPQMSLDEQDWITSRNQSCELLIQAETSKLNKLRKQKHGLMSDLLTGKVRVTA